jgi:hypothetical protein
MELPSSRAPEVRRDLDQYRQLNYKQLTEGISKKEEELMVSLKRKLVRRSHGSDPALLSLELKNIKKHLQTERRRGK